MTDNFRSYMDHLSHLTPEADPISSLESQGQTRWGDNVVDMCSDESDGEDCPVNHYSDSNSTGQGQATHLRRNPNFPYQSLASPRVAWGERPREAWNDELPEPHRMFDSANPYALFNLPHPGLRGNLHHHSRRPHVKTEPLHMHRDNTNRQHVIRRNSRDNLPIPACRPHFSHRDNHAGHENTSPSHVDCEENQSSLSHGNHRTRQPRFGNPEINPSCSIPQSDSLGILPTSTTVNSDRDPCHITSDLLLESAQSSGGGVFQARSVLPRLSSQESMDTTSDSEECSDVDVMTVPHLHYAHDEIGEACSGHISGNGNLGSRKSRIIRPKAVKLETGKSSQRFEGPTSDGNVSRSCSNANVDGAINRNSSSAVTQDSGSLSPSLGIPLPGLSSNSNDYRSSEARVLHLGTHQHCVAQPQPCHLKVNSSSKKGHKDKHNSVIKCKAVHRACQGTNGSIDLTDNDPDPTPASYHGDESRRSPSPVVQDVLLASADDDSDIEVVKIESSR